MSNPIPLTANPSDPNSPKGAVPVTLFGVEGGASTPPSAFTLLDPHSSIQDQVDEYRIELIREGNLCQLSLLIVFDSPLDLSGGALLTETPEGYTPVGSAGIYVSGGGVSGEGGVGDPLALTYSLGTGQVVSVAYPGTATMLTCTMVYFTNDPFPESPPIPD